MKNITVSRIFHVLALLTFLLPFFYTGCGNISPEKEKAMEQAIIDSLKEDSIAKREMENPGTISENVSQASEGIITESLNEQNKNTDTAFVDASNQSECETFNKEEDLLSDRLATNYTGLSFILKPSDESYSGLGSALNMIPFFRYFLLTFSLILLMIGLLIKFIEASAIKTSIVLEVLIIFGIVFSRSPSWNCEKLWGFGVSVTVVSLLLLYDIFILVKSNMGLK